MDLYDETVRIAQLHLNSVLERADYDLSDPAVLAASVDYDRLMNERMLSLMSAKKSDG